MTKEELLEKISVLEDVNEYLINELLFSIKEINEYYKLCVILSKKVNGD